jgi:CHAT domain-containing protein
VEGWLPLSGLVIVSACGGSRGPRRPGDDSLADLGGAFLRAGAPAVMVSGGALELTATIDLMESVHERLAAGDSPAEALRVARSARAPGTSVEHDLAAARLQIFGAGHVPVF